MSRLVTACSAAFALAMLVAGCGGPEEAPETAPPPAAAEAEVQAEVDEEEEEASPLLAWADAEPEDGAPPLTVQFEADVEGGMPPLTYRWTFGDGSPDSSEANPNAHRRPVSTATPPTSRPWLSRAPSGRARSHEATPDAGGRIRPF